jgi:hypothetical protein
MKTSCTLFLLLNCEGKKGDKVEKDDELEDEK